MDGQVTPLCMELEPCLFKAADIWSLGVTLYSLVYGRVPFFDNNIVALYNIIKTKNVEVVFFFVFFSRYLYTNLACLSGCLFVCLFVSNKRQNG